MSDHAITVSFANRGGVSSTLERRFVHLEQIKDFEQNESVNMFDIQQMVARASTGLSARTYKQPGCMGYIESNTVITQFDFYAWTSNPTLEYTLKTSFGEITEPEIIQKDVEFSVTFGLSDVEEFDFMLEELTSWYWETLCYDSQGRVVEDVEIAMDGLTTIRATSPIFGVARIKGRKRGALHHLTTRLVKAMEQPPTQEEFDDSGAGDYYTYLDFMGMFFPGMPGPEQYVNYNSIGSWTGINGEDHTATLEPEPVNMTGIKISNLSVTVTAYWTDLDGEIATSSLRLDVPPCVKDLLEACGTDTNGDGIIDDWGFDDLLSDEFKICDGSKQAPWNVYISGCTGKVLLAIRPEDDDNSWCGKSADFTTN